LRHLTRFEGVAAGHAHAHRGAREHDALGRRVLDRDVRTRACLRGLLTLCPLHLDSRRFFARSSSVRGSAHFQLSPGGNPRLSVIGQRVVLLLLRRRPW
jgi:hypothetical protein